MGFLFTFLRRAIIAKAYGSSVEGVVLRFAIAGSGRMDQATRSVRLNISQKWADIGLRIVPGDTGFLVFSGSSEFRKEREIHVQLFKLLRTPHKNVILLLRGKVQIGQATTGKAGYGLFLAGTHDI